VSCKDAGVSDKLLTVLKPDNARTPSGMTLRMETKGKSLECVIEADSPSVAVSTTLAILRDALLFQEVWLLSQARRG